MFSPWNLSIHEQKTLIPSQAYDLVMKNLLTHCPRCRAQFYADGKNRFNDKIQVYCPYCGLSYRDRWDEPRVKETKYYWELFKGVYPFTAANGDKKFHLKIGAVFLLLTVVLFSVGLVSLFLFEGLSAERGGFGIAGAIFIVMTLMGVFNAFGARSFVVSMTGAIFAVLNSIVWSVLNSDRGFILLGGIPPSLYLLSSLFLSLVGLILFIKNRKVFRYGY